MRNAPYLQVFVMAAIVATLFLPPAAGAAWLACALSGLSFASLVTFGHRMGVVTGLAAWWVVFFALASVYAASMRRAS